LNAIADTILRFHLIESIPVNGTNKEATTKKITTKDFVAWPAKMEALPGVTSTLADRNDLLEIYQRYADGTANTKVGDAVRQGKEAHDI
jgi:hypothetical protein